MKLIYRLLITIFISALILGLSMLYTRDDAPLLGAPKDLSTSEQLSENETSCGLTLYIKDPEKVKGWPFGVKQIYNDTLCGAYPDKFYLSSLLANGLIFFTAISLSYMIIIKIREKK